jgi:hypothetical protein
MEHLNLDLAKVGVVIEVKTYRTELKTKHQITNQNAPKHRHLGNDWQIISKVILGSFRITPTHSRLGAKVQSPRQDQ